MGSILFLMVLGLLQLHPIHVSVTDAEWDKERKALEFTSRIFLDDIEKHIRIQINEPYLDLTSPAINQSTDDLVKNYLFKNLMISVNEKEKEISYVGHEIEGDAVILYYQVLQVKKLKSLAIRSTILADLYEDQVNMLHIKWNGSLRSMKMTRDEPSSSLDFSN